MSRSVFPQGMDMQVEVLSAEDRELLDAARAIGKAMLDMRMPGLSQLL
jgi:hypothetical protein